jgi:energy-coupling factor transport system permease protein
MNMTLYLDRETWIHRLDGRTKVFCLLGLCVLALIFSDPWFLLALLVWILGGLMAARALLNLNKMWVLLVLLFVYSVLLWPFFVKGQIPIFTIAGVVITQEGLTHGIGMGLRLDALLLGGLLLLSTTTIEDFSRSLQRLGLPSSMGFALSLAFRWVPTLLGAMGTVVQAQRSRGMDLASGSLWSKIRRYPPLVVPLIGHTLRQTNLLAMALETKGFGPGQSRNPYGLSRMTLTDTVWLIIMAIIVGGGVWLRWHGYGKIF